MGREAACAPPRTQYSHTTLSNLKLSPLVESCLRSIYSTGRAGRGLGSCRSGHGAPTVHGAPAVGPARAAAARPCQLLTPTTPGQTSVLRGLGHSYRRCRGVGTASTAHAAVPARRTREDARRGSEQGRLLGNMLHSRAPASTGILASSVK